MSGSSDTYSENHHVLFESKHVGSLVGDRHVDEQPLVLGQHHLARPERGLCGAERANEPYFVD